jgi:hypothetical protein
MQANTAIRLRYLLGVFFGLGERDKHARLDEMSLTLRPWGVRKNAPTVLAAKLALILVMHQVLATLGVLVWAGLLTSIALGIPRLWGHLFRMSDTRRILLAAPYYPIQIIVGLLWGWLVWRQYRHRVMLWVWVFPLIALVLGILDDLTRSFSLYPGFFSLDFRITLMHFFGVQCRLEDRCFNQIGFSLPFYAAVAYATGAWLALRFPIRSRLSNRIVESAVIMVGILILANTVWEAIGDLFYYQQWPWWAVLLAGAFEASMGACLIRFGARMRRIDNNPMPSLPTSELFSG